MQEIIIGVAVGSAIGLLIGTVLIALLAASKNTTVSCEWSSCRHNKEGFCKCGFIDLTDMTDIACLEGEDTLICKSFEWEEEVEE